ncbi:MAG: MinD/ParA family protein [Chloroflexota bacterium]|nr:MAG: CDP-3,6-dideoxy-D-glycero-L-glycero-4-hexulose-4-reductase [Chloroflexota bacterium]
MPSIISVHSFRGGTGKSNLTANIATQIAARGFRVAIVDTDIQSPGLHVLFGFHEGTLDASLNEYLWGQIEIEEAAYPVQAIAARDQERAFLYDLNLWIVPASIRTSEIARVLREGYNVGTLNDGFNRLINSFQLDYLFIDTHPGLNEETLLSVAISNLMIILLRPDQQDFQGTAVTIDVARKLEVPDIRLILNKIPSRYDSDALIADVEATYQAQVMGALPLSEDVAMNGSNNIFSVLYPDHPWSRAVQSMSDTIVTTLARSDRGQQHR